MGARGSRARHGLHRNEAVERPATAKPGVYELDYGITVRQLLEMVGAENAQAVQMGGPSGRCLAPKDYARTISFDDLPTGGSVMIFGPERDIIEVMRQFTAFFAEESCGWCTPCRAGTTLLEKGLEKILEGRATDRDLRELESLGLTGSHEPVRSGTDGGQPGANDPAQLPDHADRVRPITAAWG